ncbi:MAG TPA: hypothetical protein VK497_04750 [Candidatus Saccharimonadales bacterium]|nr:hypothetical protein [Candidatus Saccharimonadales bacterium]
MVELVQNGSLLCAIENTPVSIASDTANAIQALSFEAAEVIK